MARKARDRARARDLYLQRTYGITSAQYEAMFAAQHGSCDICGRPPKKRRLHVDHDHKTGKVRGLLCFRCNSQLVRNHTLEELRKAVDYLERHIRTDG